MINEWLRAIILGSIQGITEFLPISSSAHLLILPWLLDWEPTGLTFDVLLHGGSLIALIVYFRDPLLAIGKGIFFSSSRTKNWYRLLQLLIIGTIPLVLMGLLLMLINIEQLRTPYVTVFNLMFFGVMLWLADKIGNKKRTIESISLGHGLLIGFAQSLALMPGVSRSGVTLTATLLMGLSRHEAANFSFLLGIPAICLAISHNLLNVFLAENLFQIVWESNYLIGILASFITSILSIHFLIWILGTRSINWFVIYRIFLSLIVMVSIVLND